MTGAKHLKYINAGVLNIAYYEVGSSDGIPIFLMHGFPYDAHSYDEVSKHLAPLGYRCIIPFLRGYGQTTFLSTDTPRSGQQAALGLDLFKLMDALKIESAFLGGYDWGGRAACIVTALWPDRVRGLVSCGTGYNIQDIPNADKPASPEEEKRYWYQYYFHTDRGQAGLEVNRHALCKFIWKLWSPTWKFSDATFEQTALAFDNPDFVEIVIHSYRHRFGGIMGDPNLDTIENRLVKQPDISVPSIVLVGTDDGVDPPSNKDLDSSHFSGAYEKRLISGAGHNLPQEKPGAFVKAILALK